MAFKYKLVEKCLSPGDPDAGKNWRATPTSATPLTGKAMTRAATKNTTMAPIELEAALDLLADFVPVGYFRLTFKSKGSDSVEGFDPKTMLYDVRPVFVVDRAFRKRVQDNIVFEDGGVQKDGVSYATRADFIQATNPGGTTTPTPGGGNEDDTGSDGSFG